MIEVVPRASVANEAAFEGVGLHSGIPVKMWVRPGSGGIQFSLGKERVHATLQNVSETARCTCIGPIRTAEHLMSALAALEITDTEIELSTNELPGLDGSAIEFYSLLLSAGREKLPDREVNIPYKRIYLQEGDVSIAISSGTGRWRFEYQTGDRWPKSQIFETTSVVDDYLGQIAAARTFALEEELEGIAKAGLGKGLDQESALIIGEKDYINSPRFLDEPVRHKLLDLIGDFYLSGIPIRKLNVSAIRSGHRTNVQAAKLLAEYAKVEQPV